MVSPSADLLGGGGVVVDLNQVGGGCGSDDGGCGGPVRFIGRCDDSMMTSQVGWMSYSGGRGVQDLRISGSK